MLHQNNRRDAKALARSIGLGDRHQVARRIEQPDTDCRRRRRPGRDACRRVSPGPRSRPCTARRDALRASASTDGSSGSIRASGITRAGAPAPGRRSSASSGTASSSVDVAARGAPQRREVRAGAERARRGRAPASARRSRPSTSIAKRHSVARRRSRCRSRVAVTATGAGRRRRSGRASVRASPLALRARASS